MFPTCLLNIWKQVSTCINIQPSFSCIWIWTMLSLIRICLLFCDLFLIISWQGKIHHKKATAQFCSEPSTPPPQNKQEKKGGGSHPRTRTIDVHWRQKLNKCIKRKESEIHSWKSTYITVGYNRFFITSAAVNHFIKLTPLAPINRVIDVSMWIMSKKVSNHCFFNKECGGFQLHTLKFWNKQYCMETSSDAS